MSALDNPAMNSLYNYYHVQGPVGEQARKTVPFCDHPVIHACLLKLQPYLHFIHGALAAVQAVLLMLLSCSVPVMKWVIKLLMAPYHVVKRIMSAIVKLGKLILTRISNQGGHAATRIKQLCTRKPRKSVAKK